MKRFFVKYGRLLIHILFLMFYYSLFYVIPFLGNKFHFDYEQIYTFLKNLSYIPFMLISYLICLDIKKLVWNHLCGID